MREKKAVALKDAYRLLNPGSVVLVSAAHEGGNGPIPCDLEYASAQVSASGRGAKWEKTPHL